MRTDLRDVFHQTRRGSSRLVAALVLGLWICHSSPALALPAYGVKLVVKHNDGTPLDVWVWGDEDYRFMQDANGYALIRDPVSLDICYAKLNAAGNGLESTGAKWGAAVLPPINAVKDLHLDPSAIFSAVVPFIRSSGRGADARTAPKHQSVGTRNVLCLIIDFPDSSATVSPAEVNNYFNQAGYAGFGNNGSVRDYYLNVSNGNFTLTHEIHGYYRAANSRSYYDNPSKNAYGAPELIKEALTGLQGGIDFTKFDADNDGLIDAITVLYAGDMPAENNAPLWPHRWDMRAATPAQNFTSSSGKTGALYMICNVGADPAIGTVCHELGHLVCGFDDYYDTTYSSVGLGDWCLMASGNWNGNAKNPAPPHAYLRWKAGWLTPIAANNSIASLACNYKDVIKHDNPANAQEYFLVSAIQKTGRNANIPGEGLAIFHIDETKTSNNEYQHSASQHYESALAQTDGKFHLETKRGNGGNEGDGTDLFSESNGASFTDTSSPINAKWWDGSTSGFKITQIGPSGGSSISFTLFSSATAPVITSGPTANPNPASAGSEVIFSVAASDPNNLSLTYAWDFGDGSTGTGDTARHTFAALGTYAVTLTVQNASGDKTLRTLNLSVAEMKPVTLGVSKFTMNFRTGRDNWDMKFSHADFIYTDKTSFTAATDGSIANIYIGGTQVDSLKLFRGKAKNSGSFSWNYKKGEIRYLLRNYPLQPILAAYGAANDDISGQVTVPVAVEVGGSRYGGSYSYFYTAAKAKVGKGKAN